VKKGILIIFYILISCQLWLGCQSNSCTDLGNIEVSPWLQEQAAKTGFPYCSVMRQAKDKNKVAIAKLIRFAYKTDDDTAVEHGIAFTQLALELGDDFFLEFVQQQGRDQQLLIAKMLDAAMEFSEPKLEIRAGLPKTAGLLLPE
jgi:hypothetical protein